MVLVVAGPPHHIRVPWGMECLPVLFTNTMGTNRHIVAFSRDLVEFTFPPTIKINPAWRNPEYFPVVLSATAFQVLPGRPYIAKEISALTTANNRLDLLLVFLAPLHFIHPILSAPYLSPPSGVHTDHRTSCQSTVGRPDGTISHMAEISSPTTLTGFHSYTATRVGISHHSAHKRLLQHMVSTAAYITPRGDPTIIMQAPQLTHQVPEKNKEITPLEKWGLQQIALT